MKHTPREPDNSFRMKRVPASWPIAPPRIVFVGEAPGETEARKSVPFVGAAGNVLNDLLRMANIKRSECMITNVFQVHPPNNDLDFFFIKPQKIKENGLESVYFGKGSPFFSGHGYLRTEWVAELERLKQELIKAQPRVIVALGALALWALTGHHEIGKYRGYALESTLVPGVRVIPTYHPAYIIRKYDWFPISGADLIKVRAAAESESKLCPDRQVWIEPTISDLLEFERVHLQDVELLSVDIETDYKRTKLIECIGFAPNPYISLVIPFIDRRKPGWNYWNTAAREVRAWEWVKRILEDPTVPKLGQGFLYDVSWLDFKMGIKVRGIIEDTMILHHSLQPEMQKSLNFLGSVYTNERAWKQRVDFSAHKVEA